MNKHNEMNDKRHMVPPAVKISVNNSCIVSLLHICTDGFLCTLVGHIIVCLEIKGCLLLLHSKNDR